MRPALRLAGASLSIFLVLVPSPGKAVVSGGGDPLATETYDIRVFGGAALARLKEAYASPRLRTAEAEARDRARSLAEASERLRSLAPGARIELSPLPTGVEVVASAGTPLTVAEPELDGPAVVRGFLRSWPGIYGLSPEQIEHLEVLSESRQDGLTVVRLRQIVNGRPVFQSDTRAVLDRNGRLLHTVGRLIPAIDESVAPTEWRVSSREALRVALASAGSNLDLVTRPATSEQVYFPLAPGFVVPAWAHVAFTRGPADWYTVVDARNGTLLWRKNIRYNFAAQQVDSLCADAYVQDDERNTPADSPAPGNNSTPGSNATVPENQEKRIERRIVPLVAGWISDEPTTTGNNVDAYLDRKGTDDPKQGVRPVATQAKRRGKQQAQECNLGFFFNYTPPPKTVENPDEGDKPEDYRLGAVANLFYLVNWFHDRLFNLGFNKEAHNFQEDDPVLAEAQYAAEVEEDFGIFNLASFSVPPDGSSGLLRLSVWDGPDPDRDASLDAQIVFHELAHGVTSRLIGNGACLNWYPGRALAEGWSDFYALALLNSATDDDPDGVYSIGGYTAYKLGNRDNFKSNYYFGLRRFPYSTKTDVNPLTWKDADDTTACAGTKSCKNPYPTEPPASTDPMQSSVDWELAGASAPHNAGELWALSLWEMRSQIINSLPEEDDDRIATGNETALRIVTKSLTMEPMHCDPSFIEARDLLIDADCDSDESCPNETSIWQGFAKRGLGYGARDSGGIATHFGIHESFHVPFLDLDPIDPQIEIESGDKSYVVPNTQTIIKVHLHNPWFSQAASAKATLNCTSSNVEVVTEGPVQYGPIEKQGKGSATFVINVLQTAKAGESLGCRLVLSEIKPTDLFSLDEPPSVDLGLRVGQRSATDGEMIFFKKTEENGSILDGDLRGQSFTLTIEDDPDNLNDQPETQISSLALRIDDLSHPWIGDLTVFLRAPNGYGTEMIYRLAGGFPGAESFPLLGHNSGQCLKDMVIQKEGKDFLKEGLLQTQRDACFADTWAPPLESDSWLTSPNDQIPPQHQLDGFKGISSKGVWTLFITDAVPDGNGKAEDPPALLKSWSLVITPVSYTLTE